MLIGLCTAESVRIAGIGFHEWLGISLIAVFVAHVLLAWSWVEFHTKQYFVQRVTRDRTSYLLNLGLYAVSENAGFRLISEFESSSITSSPLQSWLSLAAECCG
jgi:hypothetical protein